MYFLNWGAIWHEASLPPLRILDAMTVEKRARMVDHVHNVGEASASSRTRVPESSRIKWTWWMRRVLFMDNRCRCEWAGKCNSGNTQGASEAMDMCNMAWQLMVPTSRPGRLSRQHYLTIKYLSRAVMRFRPESGGPFPPRSLAEACARDSQTGSGS